MAEITIVKPHDEGESALEVTVNGEKWSLTRGETVDVPEYIATEVRRSLAQRDSLSLADIDEREGEPESGGSGGGGGESSSAETATIEITVTDGTPAITSGEFPDWCTESNTDYIFGELVNTGMDDYEDSRFGEYRISHYESQTIIEFANSGDTAVLSTDLTIFIISGEDITSGTLTVTLIYMPEE